MNTPHGLRAVRPSDAPAPVPDMRTWWGRNAPAFGTILGTAALTVLAGAGGMTGLAHVAGIATTKDTAEIKKDLDGISAKQAASDTVDAERFKAQAAQTAAVLKALASLRTDVAKLTKKPKNAPVVAPVKPTESTP